MMSIYTVITPRINFKLFNTAYSKNSPENIVTHISQTQNTQLVTAAISSQ